MGVTEGICRFMAAWAREDDKTSANQQRKRKAVVEAEKVEVAPGMTVKSSRCFRVALIRHKDFRMRG